MNIENAKTLVGQLERLPDEKFAMNTWVRHDDCGTIACIAGWCSLLNGGPEKYGGGIRDFTSKFLNLDDGESDYLFHGEWSPKHPTDITRADAIAELKRMIAEEQGVQ